MQDKHVAWRLGMARIYQVNGTRIMHGRPDGSNRSRYECDTVIVMHLIYDLGTGVQQYP
jgi:hypothetical protein